jgi:hypothetical protein
MLFDPFNVQVTHNASSNGAFSDGTWTPTNSASNILNTDINNLLDNGTNVTITTAGSGSDAGNITISAPITQSGGFDTFLSLEASNTITLNPGADITSTAGMLSMEFIAPGGVVANANITTNGGNFFATNTRSFTQGVGTVLDSGEGIINIDTGGDSRLSLGGSFAGSDISFTAANITTAITLVNDLSLTSPNAIILSSSFDGVFNLSLNTEDSVTVNNDVGYYTRIGNFTVNNAVDFTNNATIRAATISLPVSNAITLSPGGFMSSTGNIVFNAPGGVVANNDIVTHGGNFSATNTPSLILGEGYYINSGTGTINIDSGGGPLALGGDFEGAAITFTAAGEITPVNLIGNLILISPNSINIVNPFDGSFDIEFGTAGSITVNADMGANTRVGNIFVGNAVDITNNASIFAASWEQDDGSGTTNLGVPGANLNTTGNASFYNNNVIGNARIGGQLILDVNTADITGTALGSSTFTGDNIDFPTDIYPGTYFFNGVDLFNFIGGSSSSGVVGATNSAIGSRIVTIIIPPTSLSLINTTGSAATTGTSTNANEENNAPTSTSDSSGTGTKSSKTTAQTTSTTPATSSKASAASPVAKTPAPAPAPALTPAPAAPAPTAPVTPSTPTPPSAVVAPTTPIAPPTPVVPSAPTPPIPTAPPFIPPSALPQPVGPSGINGTDVPLGPSGIGGGTGAQEPIRSIEGSEGREGKPENFENRPPPFFGSGTSTTPRPRHQGPVIEEGGKIKGSPIGPGGIGGTDIPMGSRGIGGGNPEQQEPIKGPQPGTLGPSGIVETKEKPRNIQDKGNWLDQGLGR